MKSGVAQGGGSPLNGNHKMSNIWKTAALGLALSTCAATAQAICVPHDALVIELEKTGGHKVFAGLSVKGHITEMWANEGEGEWAAFVVLPDGNACMVDSGAGIIVIEPAGMKL